MIDWNRVAELKEEVGEDDFAEVIEMFFEEVSEVLDNLSPGSLENLRGDLHFLKGSALNIGLDEVSRLCRDAETGLRDRPGQIVDVSVIRAAFEASKSFFESSAPT